MSVEELNADDSYVDLSNSMTNTNESASAVPGVLKNMEVREMLESHIPVLEKPDCLDTLLPSHGIVPDSDSSHIKEDKLYTRFIEHQSTDNVPSPSLGCTDLMEGTKSSPSDIVHKIKRIKWKDIEVPIVTQNNNGPCPLLALVNVMTLKGQISISADRTEITGGELVSVVGNALFDQPHHSVPADMHRHLERNTEDAVSILPKLLTGLDVNVKFCGVRDFEFTPELCVFDLLGINLYHGWVVDPDSEAASVVQSLSYNQLADNIIGWRDEAMRSDDNTLLMKAILCEEFMLNTISQLTIHGLFELVSTISKGEIAVLFRNNHFSTIYRQDDVLYQLLTDQGFLHENMVWETLTDIDASFSEFVSADFKPISPSNESGAVALDPNMTTEQQINSDQQLAALLQHEADMVQKQQQHFENLKESMGLHHVSDEELAKRLQEEEERLAEEGPSDESRQRNPSSRDSSQKRGQSPTTTANAETKKKKECVIL